MDVFGKTHIGMKLSDKMNPVQRRSMLEKVLHISLSNIGQIKLQEEKDVHCENLIGATAIPLGVAGPFTYIGSKKERFIPLATTEGALVASVNRGCKAIFDSGGAQVEIETVGTTRAPVFDIQNIKKGLDFKKWVASQSTVFSKLAKETSSHIKLLGYDTKIIGTYAYVRFRFNTEDAMGMNMATIASDKIVQYIEKKQGIRCISLSSNYCVDKKPSWLNFISGRGKEGWGEVIITRRTMEDILKTTPEKLFEVWLSKCVMGSLASGSLGFNAHFANIVAAFFAATGQDLAHVVEGSMGVTTVKILPEGDVYVSVYMPAIMVGTVGGGTKLKCKQEAISLMQITSSNDLAKALVVAVLAGELSLLSSLSAGTLAQVHKKLGR